MPPHFFRPGDVGMVSQSRSLIPGENRTPASIWCGYGPSSHPLRSNMGFRPMYKKKLQNEATNAFPHSWPLLHVSVCLTSPLPSPTIFVRYLPLISFHRNGSPIRAPWFPRCRFNFLPSSHCRCCHRLSSGRHSTSWLFPAAIEPATAINCVYYFPRVVWPASGLRVIKKW